MSILKEIEASINSLEKNYTLISSERRKLLNQFASYISELLRSGNEVNLTFICTHNSRRSHFAHIWAQTAAEYYNITNVNCYSGGTEITEFNQSAVSAIVEKGFNIEKKSDSKNPIYFVLYSLDKKPLECYSKLYNDPANPQKNFTAVMTCSDADKNCPFVEGADFRYSISYKDPKIFDGTELESEKYKEKCSEIGREMLYLFSKVQAVSKII